MYYTCPPSPHVIIRYSRNVKRGLRAKKRKGEKRRHFNSCGGFLFSFPLTPLTTGEQSGMKPYKFGKSAPYSIHSMHHGDLPKGFLCMHYGVFFVGNTTKYKSVIIPGSYLVWDGECEKVQPVCVPLRDDLAEGLEVLSAADLLGLDCGGGHGPGGDVRRDGRHARVPGEPVGPGGGHSGGAGVRHQVRRRRRLVRRPAAVRGPELLLLHHLELLLLLWRWQWPLVPPRRHRRTAQGRHDWRRRRSRWSQPLTASHSHQGTNPVTGVGTALDWHKRGKALRSRSLLFRGHCLDTPGRGPSASPRSLHSTFFSP